MHKPRAAYKESANYTRAGCIFQLLSSSSRGARVKDEVDLYNNNIPPRLVVSVCRIIRNQIRVGRPSPVKRVRPTAIKMASRRLCVFLL